MTDEVAPLCTSAKFARTHVSGARQPVVAEPSRVNVHLGWHVPIPETGATGLSATQRPGDVGSSGPSQKCGSSPWGSLDGAGSQLSLVGFKVQTGVGKGCPVTPATMATKSLLHTLMFGSPAGTQSESVVQALPVVPSNVGAAAASGDDCVPPSSPPRMITPPASEGDFDPPPPPLLLPQPVASAAITPPAAQSRRHRGSRFVRVRWVVCPRRSLFSSFIVPRSSGEGLHGPTPSGDQKIAPRLLHTYRACPLLFQSRRLAAGGRDGPWTPCLRSERPATRRCSATATAAPWTRPWTAARTGTTRPSRWYTTCSLPASSRSSSAGWAALRRPRRSSSRRSCSFTPGGATMRPAPTSWRGRSPSGTPSDTPAPRTSRSANAHPSGVRR